MQSCEDPLSAGSYALGTLNSTAGVPDPMAMDQYQAVACYQQGYTVGGEQQASE